MEGSRDTVIHPSSSIAVLPQLELWGIPPTQISIEKDVETEYRPSSVIDITQTFDYKILSARDEYINISEMYLYIQGRVRLRKNEGAITKGDWDSVIPAQYFLHSLFEQVDIIIGDKNVTMSPQTYAHRAYIEALLGFSDDIKKSYLSCALWGSSKMRNEIIRPEVNKEEKAEFGVLFELWGRLHLDLAFQNRLILGGSEITVRLHPNKPSFYFQAGSGINPTLDLKEATLHVHKSKVTPHILSAHEQALRVAPTRYPIVRCEVKRSTINVGQIDPILQNVVRGQMPRRIFVVFIDADAFNGNYAKNPYDFKNYNINYLVANIDGTSYPYQPYSPNFKKGLYLKSYIALHHALNQHRTDCYSTIDRKDFAKDFTIFAFNFAPDLSNGPDCCSHVNYIKGGSSLSLHVRFAEAVKEPIDVLIYCEFDNLIQVDEVRNAYTNFN
jgi:hypothetical protein